MTKILQHKMEWGARIKDTKCRHPHAEQHPYINIGLHFCPDCKSWLTPYRNPAREKPDPTYMDQRARIDKLLDERKGFPVPQAPANSDLHLEKFALIGPQGKDTPECIGLDEVAKAIREKCGKAPMISNRTFTLEAIGRFPGIILVGTSGKDRHVKELLRHGLIGQDPSYLGQDSFILSFQQNRWTENRPLILCLGANARGTLYACLELADRIRQNKPVSELKLVERPVYLLRGGHLEGESNSIGLGETAGAVYHPRKEELLAFARMRGNLVLPRFYTEQCVTLHRIPWIGKAPPEVFRRIAELKGIIKELASFGFMPALQFSLLPSFFCDELVFQKYPEARAVNRPDLLPNYAAACRYCPSHPITRELLSAMIEELMKRFPQVMLLETWTGSDPPSLYCECKRCLDYPMSQRLADYHTLALQTMRSIRPEGIVFSPLALIEQYRDAWVRRSPGGAHFMEYWRFPSGTYAHNSWVPDFNTPRVFNYIPMISYAGEGLIDPRTSVFDLQVLNRDIRQYEHAGRLGIYTHHPIDVGSMGFPEKYSGSHEPFHYAWLKWLWNPAQGTPDEVLSEWADKKFPGVAHLVIKAYQILPQAIRYCQGSYVLAWAFHSYSNNWDAWQTLDPDASLGGHRLAVEKGIYRNREVPYGHLHQPKQYYIWPDHLRHAGLSEKTIPLWLKETDLSPYFVKIVKLLDQAVAKQPKNRALRFIAQQWHYHLNQALAHREYIWSGLLYNLGIIAQKSGNKATSKRLLHLSWQHTLRSYGHALDAATGPASKTLCWQRWQIQIPMGIKILPNMLRRVDQALGRTEATDEYYFKQAVPLSSLGWQPALAGKRRSSTRYQPIDLTPIVNAGMQTNINDVGKYQAKTWTNSPGCPQVPLGHQTFFGIPFHVREPVKADDHNWLLLTGGKSIRLPLPGTRRLSALHFLAAVHGYAGFDDPFAKIVLQYKGNHSAETVLRFGIDLSNYRFVEPTANSRVAWTSYDRREDIYWAFLVIGFSHVRILNPRPERIVTAVNVQTLHTKTGLMLLACTAER